MEQRGPRRWREKGQEEIPPAADGAPSPAAGTPPRQRERLNAIGPAVRRLRFSQDLTQDALAARCAVAGCDISRGTLAKIEAQIRGVSEVELFTLAQALRVPMSGLFPADFARQLKRGQWWTCRPLPRGKTSR